MSDAWKKHDLGGGGLQQANLRLARSLRRRRVAYPLLLLFPFGAHSFYLRRPLTGALLLGLTGATLIALQAGRHDAALVFFAVELGVALYDLARMEPRLTALNKALRMQAYLRTGGGVPPGFRGQYTDEGDGAAQSGAPRAPSFSEQERRLAEIEREKKRRGS